MIKTELKVKKFCARLRLGSRQAAYLGQARRRILNVAHGAAGLVWNCSCSSRPCDGSHFLPVLLVKGDAATAVILPVDGLSSVVLSLAGRKAFLKRQPKAKSSQENGRTNSRNRTFERKITSEFDIYLK